MSDAYREPWFGRLFDAVVDKAWASALALGILFGALTGALVGIDYVVTKDLPLEYATVVANDVGPDQVACGRTPFPKEDERVTTFAVQNPPAGLPRTFQQRASCSYAGAIGEVIPVKRDGVGPDVSVWIFPVTLADVLWFAGVAAAGTLAVVLVSLLVRAAALRAWARRFGSGPDGDQEPPAPGPSPLPWRQGPGPE